MANTKLHMLRTFQLNSLFLCVGIGIQFCALAQINPAQERDAIGRHEQELLRRQQQEQQQRQVLERSRDLRSPQGQEKQPAALPVEIPCFAVEQIKLKDAMGASVPHFEWLKTELNAHEDPAVIGRCIGALGVNWVIERAHQILVARGFITTRILATQQDMSHGTLVLTLIAGRISDIRLSEPIEPRANLTNALPMQAGEVLNLRDVEQALENLKRVPTAEADIQIAPASGDGAQLGESDLIVSYRQSYTVTAAAAGSVNAPTSSPSSSAVRTIGVNGADGVPMPSGSLYKTRPSLVASYLIETDTRFTDNKLWLGSDYMTQSLSLDPTVTQKRLGDGFYEQKLIREQVAQLTGRRFLADYTSDEQEYQALMNSGITYAKQYKLRPGVALTAQQIAQLTSDIVWLVEQTFTLPDGSSQKVLVPQGYVKVQPGDLDGSGALLAGKEVNINLRGNLINSGTIAGRNVVNLTAENVNNLGGRIDGSDVSVAAKQDLKNIGGSIDAVNSLRATAGRDLTIETTTRSATSNAGASSASRTTLDRVAGLYVSGQGGTLVASAGRDLNIVAGVVSNAGSGTTSLGASNNVNISTVKTASSDRDVWDADNFRLSNRSQDVGSTVQGGGGINISAGQTVSTTAANVQALGALNVNAKNVEVKAGQASADLDMASKVSGGGFFGGATSISRDTTTGTTALGSNLASGIKVSVSIGTSSSQSNSTTTSNTSAGSTVKAGGNVNIKATGQGEGGGNLTVQGSNVSAAKDVSLSATQDVNILASADTESNRSSNKSSSTSVGLSVGIGSGGAGLSLDIAASRGKGQANSDSTTYNNSHVSAGNSVNITSGGDTNVIGGTVKANQVTANVGGNLNLESLQDTATSQASQKTTGMALSIPIYGTGGSASFSQSKQNSDSNYASVNEQSGIKAGEGGFAINVGGNTDLKGATLPGTTDASKNTLTTNTLTTSDISNSMSASASSSGVSVGTNMMDGKYAMGKAIAGNLLNNGSASQSDASKTTSAISAGSITVGGKNTDTSKEKLTDSNGKTVSTDTSNTNRTLAKADVTGLQKSAQEQQAANMLAVNTLTVVGDKIYRKETEQKRLDRIQCESSNKENCSRQENVTLDQVKAINGKITAVNNGMLNTEDQAAIVAYMQSTGMQLQDGVLVVVNPKINDVLSEAAWVAWKKVEQVFGFGTSSAGELNLALQTIAASQGAKLDTNSHSAGNFAVDEMLRKLQASGTTNAAVGTVTMFGSPVNAQNTSDKVNVVTSAQGTTQQATHVNDFVGALFGGNARTGGNPSTGALDAHSSYTGELTTSDKDKSQLPVVRDLLSPEQIKDAADKSWGFSRPVVVPPRAKPAQEGEKK